MEKPLTDFVELKRLNHPLPTSLPFDSYQLDATYRPQEIHLVDSKSYLLEKFVKFLSQHFVKLSQFLQDLRLS
jgi:hypothetical protein